MNLIWLCITSALSVTLPTCAQSFDTSHIRVFPEANQTIAGVFQVSHLNDLNQPQYAFNASEARRLCLSLGVDIASKAQVQDALTRGLQTCRFGWVDEHFAVIPRREAVSNCGQNQTGLVTWRAGVTHKFDVFCFNESDAANQLRETTASTRDYSGQTQFHFKAVDSTQTAPSTSSPSLLTSSSSLKTIDSEAEPARFVGNAQGSAGGKVILITSTCALLLFAVIILIYIKLRRSRSDMKQQKQYVQTEEWVCVTAMKETKKAAQGDERIEVGDDAS